MYSKRDKMRDEKEDGIQAMAIFNKVPIMIDTRTSRAEFRVHGVERGKAVVITRDACTHTIKNTNAHKIV